jgi:hypothetical protein
MSLVAIVVNTLQSSSSSFQQKLMNPIFCNDDNDVKKNELKSIFAHNIQHFYDQFETFFFDPSQQHVYQVITHKI